MPYFHHSIVLVYAKYVHILYIYILLASILYEHTYKHKQSRIYFFLFVLLHVCEYICIFMIVRVYISRFLLLYRLLEYTLLIEYRLDIS